jgi:neutral ceramidase
MDVSLSAGAGRSVITPPIGTPLYGYPTNRPCKSVHDNLTADAISFEYKGIRAVMISASLCVCDFAMSEKIRGIVADTVDLPAENVIFTTTHTHSGPALIDIPDHNYKGGEYFDSILIPALVSAAKQAEKSKKPAVVGFGTVDSDIGANRRQLQQDGSVLLGYNPYGLYDPIMTVIGFKGIDDAPIANIVHYGCHGTAAGINFEVTRDWPGVMTDRLEQQSGALTLFFNGPEGDIGPRLSNGNDKGAREEIGGDISQAEEIGGRAAVDAVRAWRTIKEYRTIPLKLITGDISLPYAPFPVEAEAREGMKSLKGIKQLNGAQQDSREMWMEALREYDAGNPIRTHFTFRQTLVALGPIVFVPFPYEIFVEICLRLRLYSPFQHTLSLSNANGTDTYFPSRDQICRGGYEVRCAYAGKAYRLVFNADDHIINENMRLIAKLYET